MRTCFDTEFIDDGKTIELLSIGMVGAGGQTYYAEPAETDRSRACPWVTANVLPHLTGPVKPRAMIAQEIIDFAGDEPEFWAYYAAYDWVALCQLYGRMLDVPKHWPHFVRDLRPLIGPGELMRLAPIKGVQHNALADAMQLHEAYIALTEPAAIPRRSY